MQTVNIRHKLYLHWGKTLLILVILASAQQVSAQRRGQQINNPEYDSRSVSYGFLLGIHTNAYQLKYSDQFVSKSFDSLYSISPRWRTGFDLGFILNFRLEEFFDFRITPTVSFNEYIIDYQPLGGLQIENNRESTVVEMPILLKYKSVRHGNTRMYLIGGLKPGFEASAKNTITESGDDYLNTKSFNLSLDAGIGLDVYYPLFKFSPEIRFSRGIMNLIGEPNDYSAGLERVNTNTISLLFFFQ